MTTSASPVIKDDILASSSEWQRVWEQCDYATYFHSPEWIDILHSYSGENITPYSRQITFSDGKSAILVLSATKVVKGWITVYESAPLSVYGGWISADSLNDKHAALITSLWHKKYPRFIWRANPFHPLVATFLSQKGFKEDHTYAVPLQKYRNDLIKKLRRNTLRNIRKAEKMEFSFDKIQEHHISDYYDIYKQSQERWKGNGGSRSHYGIEIFKSLYNSPHCDFWGVFNEKQLICAGPILKSSNHAVSWLGLAHKDFMSSGTYEFFYYQIIQYYQHQNFTWFDFNPSSGLKGVDHFKKGFATVKLSAPILDRRPAILKGLQNIRSLLHFQTFLNGKKSRM